MANYHTYGNSPIVRSIPIQRELKRVVTLKFNWLCRHNGPRYASDVFSSARVLLMQFLAKELPETDLVNQFPLGKAICKRIAHLVQSNPHPWLDLFKLYTSFKQPLQSVPSSEKAMTDRLGRDAPIALLPLDYIKRLSDVPKLRPWGIDLESYPYVLPDPSWYKDWNNDQSSQYEEDVASLPNIVFSNKYGWLFEPLMPLLDGILDFEFCGDTTFIGQIHHIPKKGTVKRRPIAVPNRFFQTALQPFNDYLRSYLKLLPSDCTFDQNKFDQLVKSRLNDSLYVGSADLSAASDNLPRINSLAYLWNLRDSTVGGYCDVIDSLCKEPWWNGDHPVHFRVGQPLGLLPSFPLLALTNHICVWVAAGQLGYSTVMDKYCLLGDDILFFDEQLRARYIDNMEYMTVPMSMHKSYQGNLAEFAGKIFIKSQPVVYSPDHLDLRYDSLFDYQRATRRMIPYHLLPAPLRSRWARGFASQSLALRAYNIVVASETGAGPGVNDVALPLVLGELMSHQRTTPDADARGRLVPLFRTFLVETAPDGATARNAMQTDWWKKKFRPIGTNQFKSACQLVLSANPLAV